MLLYWAVTSNNSSTYYDLPLPLPEKPYQWLLFCMAVGSGNAFKFFTSTTAAPQRFWSCKPLSLLRYHLESPQVAE